MSDANTNPSDEKLSAFLDNELASEELSGLSEQLAVDTQLRSRLSRYALISESLKGNDIKLDASGIVDQVHLALEQEPALMAPNALKQPDAISESSSDHFTDQTGQQRNTVSFSRKKTGLWTTYVGGGAIAATVAMFTVMNFNTLDNSLDSNTGNERFPVTVEVTAPENPLYTPSFRVNNMAQPASTQWFTHSSQPSQPSSDLETELNQFLIEHSEYTNQAGMPGMVPYATFVVYDKNTR